MFAWMPGFWELLILSVLGLSAAGIVLLFALRQSRSRPRPDLDELEEENSDLHAENRRLREELARARRDRPAEGIVPADEERPGGREPHA